MRVERVKLRLVPTPSSSRAEGDVPVTMSRSPDDTRLINLMDRVAAGDRRRTDAQAALRELYELTSPRLYGLALRVVRNREWAEDVLQETYLNIWRISGDYRASLSPPLAWM